MKPMSLRGRKPVAIRSFSGPFRGRVVLRTTGDADCHAALRLAMTLYSVTGSIGRPQAIVLLVYQVLAVTE